MKSVDRLTGTAPVYVSRRERMISALASSGVMALTAYVLVFGLDVPWQPPAGSTLVSVDLRPIEPPPEETAPPPPQDAPSSPAEGAPSPPNVQSRATEVVAPPQQIVILPPPIVVATQAGTGNEMSSGASDRPGPGQGAGGIGSGTGGGGYGGGGGGAETGPRRIRGRLSFSDVPASLLGPGESASVEVRYAVEANGRVSDCGIEESSGKPALDALVCRLIQRRFRFRAALDWAGNPVRSTVIETHSWSVEPDPRRS